jgi:hypothetical protein
LHCWQNKEEEEEEEDEELIFSITVVNMMMMMMRRRRRRNEHETRNTLTQWEWMEGRDGEDPIGHQTERKSNSTEIPTPAPSHPSMHISIHPPHPPHSFSNQMGDEGRGGRIHTWAFFFIHVVSEWVSEWVVF